MSEKKEQTLKSGDLISSSNSASYELCDFRNSFTAGNTSSQTEHSSKNARSTFLSFYRCEHSALNNLREPNS